MNPTLTGSTHAAILTGAEPQRSGIVANRFLTPGSGAQLTRGMAIDPDTETLVAAARRQRKRVGVVSFPSIEGTTSLRSADFGLAWSMPLTPSRMVKLSRENFRADWVPPTWTSRPQRRPSFSPVMRSRIEWAVEGGPHADVDLVAYDTTDDRQVNYDGWFVEVDGREVEIGRDGWFAIAKRSGALHGSWSKLMRVSSALDVTLYWGAIHRTTAWPDSFRNMLEEEAGFWPGAPEEQLEAGDDTFAQQLERLAHFYTAAQLATVRRMDFDLLLMYQPQIDQASHRFLGRPDGASTIRRAWQLADMTVSSLRPLLEPSRDALVVTGDHGLVVAEHELRIEQFLAENGFPAWRAVISGSFAHLYRTSSTESREAAATLLRNSGHFERVEIRTDAHHPNSGDLMVWARPSTALSILRETPAFRPVTLPFGQHGGWHTHRELHVPLYAWGAGVRPGSMGEQSQTRIARYVAELLGITSPAGAD